ncbi:hypothetical protein HMN09_01302900 [Mycena chlorophos]|uniref:Uncharacterized protein n=1 Tax=Mycena chlorophos TaxID=658473 RepID=A0A8H6VSL3_MYCCL|nr:hypothetical protein HMN09_01302900 [Mycena chlorophos]
MGYRTRRPLPHLHRPLQPTTATSDHRRPQKSGGGAKKLNVGKLTKSLKRIYKKSRMLARTIHPYIEIRGVIDVKLDELAGKSIRDEDLKWLTIYDLLVEVVPSLESVLAGGDEDKLDELVSVIQEGMNQGKHADTSKVRHAIERLISPKVDPPFHLKLKSDRGYAHQATRALLIPQNDIERIDDDRYWAKVRNGEKTLTEDDYPALMYDSTKADAMDPEEGLMEGYLPFKILRLILHGPQNTDEAVARVGGSVAAKNNVTSVTGRLIAYAHAHTLFALTTAEQWAEEVDNFNLSKWYTQMVKIFEEDPEDEKAVELLELWNREIFGDGKGAPAVASASADPAPNSVAAQIEAKRAARRAGRA